MHILRRLKAQGAEELQMEGQTRQPLVAAHHMGRAHQVIVHRMGKVVGRDPVGLEQNLVDVVLRDGQNALDKVGILKLIFHGAGRAEAQHPRLSLRKRRCNVLDGTVAPKGIFPIVAEIDLLGLLRGAHGGQLLFGTKAGVGVSLFNKLLCIDMIDVRALPLAVGAVSTHIAVLRRALIKMNAIVLQGVDQHLHRAGDLALGIGVLHAKEEHAARLVRHAFGDESLHQIAEMHKARRRRCHTRNDRALRRLACGIARLQFLRRGRNIREQKLCQCGRIHHKYLLLFKFFLYYIRPTHPCQFRKRRIRKKPL